MAPSKRRFVSDDFLIFIVGAMLVEGRVDSMITSTYIYIRNTEIHI